MGAEKWKFRGLLCKWNDPDMGVLRSIQIQVDRDLRTLRIFSSSSARCLIWGCRKYRHVPKMLPRSLWIMRMHCIQTWNVRASTTSFFHAILQLHEAIDAIRQNLAKIHNPCTFSEERPSPLEKRYPMFFVNLQNWRIADHVSCPVRYYWRYHYAYCVAPNLDYDCENAHANFVIESLGLGRLGDVPAPSRGYTQNWYYSGYWV